MPSKLPYLNVGCGYHYHEDWVNVDFASTGEGVIAHNLLNGIPYPDNSFSVVYHSHVLEHFSKKDAKTFMAECFRVLKKNGILRVAIPDLQGIITEYAQILAALRNRPDDPYLNACYDWLMLELYDQAVRNESGGAMAKYLSREELINEDFILKRCGHEVKSIIDAARRTDAPAIKTPGKKRGVFTLKKMFPYLKSVPGKLRLKIIKRLLGKEYKLYAVGKFRSEGEIHQWMYDGHALGRLLREAGFRNIHICEVAESDIPGWQNFSLEIIDGRIRKPDSLFMEATK